MYKNYPNDYVALFFIKAIGNFFFYGLRGSLVLYLASQFGFSDASAFNLYGTFMTLSFLSPILGGYLCDHFFGFRKSVLLGITLIFAGSLILSVYNQLFVILGLSLVTIGMGIFQPSTSAAVGELLNASGKTQQRDRAFTFLYIGMNFGNFVGLITCGTLSHFYGKQSIFPVLGLIFFVSVICSDRYFKNSPLLSKKGKHPPRNIRAITFIFLSIAGAFITLRWLSNTFLIVVVGFCVILIMLGKIFRESTPEEKNNLLVISLLTMLFSGYWIFAEQTGSSITLYVERVVDRSFYDNTTLPTLFFQSLNPALVVLLGPLLIRYCFQYKNEITLPEVFRRFGGGFFFMGLSLLLLGIGTPNPGKTLVSPVWISLAYVFQVLGELHIIPIGYAVVSRLSPRKHSATIMGIWMVAVSFGHYFASVVAKSTFTGKEPSISESIEQYKAFFSETALISIACSLTIFVSVYIISRLTTFKN